MVPRTGRKIFHFLIPSGHWGIFKTGEERNKLRKKKNTNQLKSHQQQVRCQSSQSEMEKFWIATSFSIYLSEVNLQ